MDGGGELGMLYNGDELDGLVVEVLPEAGQVFINVEIKSVVNCDDRVKCVRNGTRTRNWRLMLLSRCSCQHACDNLKMANLVVPRVHGVVTSLGVCKRGTRRARTLTLLTECLQQAIASFNAEGRNRTMTCCAVPPCPNVLRIQ